MGEEGSAAPAVGRQEDELAPPSDAVLLLQAGQPCRNVIARGEQGVERVATAGG